MTDTGSDMKWFYRCLLFCIAASFSYVAFQPSYNFAHLVPHDFLRGIGFSYSSLLRIESNADKVLHGLGAAALLMLLVFAKIPVLSTKCNSLISTLVVISLAEIIQSMIGRGFDVVDLLFGSFGSFCSYCLLSNR